MAAIESIGFAPGVQPAHLRFVSIARSTPLRFAHPPPLNPLAHARQVSTASMSCVSTRLINLGNLRPLCRRKEVGSWRKHISMRRCYLVNPGIDEAVRGVQRLKKSPKLFMEPERAHA
jgi:hypothetical protein